MVIWIDESKYYEPSSFPELFLLAGAAAFPLPEVSKFPFHGDYVMISPEAAAL